MKSADVVLHIKKHGENMLDDRLSAIGDQVAHGNIVAGSIIEVDVVCSGGRESDEPDRVRGAQYLLVQATISLTSPFLKFFTKDFSLILPLKISR